MFVLGLVQTYRQGSGPLRTVEYSKDGPMILSYPPEELGSVQIGDIALSYRKQDIGGTHYLGRVHFEEYLSRFYPLLRQALAPAVCIDIGANYGYTGLLMRRAFPGSHLSLVEPVPWLAEFIRHNFEANGQEFDQFHSAIVSTDTPEGRSSFGVNERSSQDSRVVAQPGWTVIETDVVTLDDLTRDVGSDQAVYIKIDTQGWEQRVFASGEAFLARHDNWFIKTEFAPKWLESQGTDPVALLKELIVRYSVHESAGRLRWNCSSLAEAIGTPLPPETAADFVNYVRNLGIRDSGWVDLFVLPQLFRRGYQTGGLSYPRKIGQ